MTYRKHTAAEYAPTLERVAALRDEALASGYGSGLYDTCTLALAGDADALASVYAALNDAAAVDAWLEWVSADSQSYLDGGKHASSVDKAAEEAAFLAELCDLCGDDGQRESIRAGRMVWTFGCPS